MTEPAVPPDGIKPPQPAAGTPAPAGDPNKPDELHDFLFRIGEMMHLARKNAAPLPAPGTPGATRARTLAKTRSFRRWRARSLVMVAAAAIAVALFMRESGAKTLPASVVGVWRTSAKGYTNRSLELATRTLAFQIDDSAKSFTRHEITRVRQSPHERGTLFRVEYRETAEDDAPSSFEFVLLSESPGIVFVNQKQMVWTRVGKEVTHAK